MVCRDLVAPYQCVGWAGRMGRAWRLSVAPVDRVQSVSESDLGRALAMAEDGRTMYQRIVGVRALVAPALTLALVAVGLLGAKPWRRPVYRCSRTGATSPTLASSS